MLVMTPMQRPWPLVGRDDELARLLNLGAEARQGKGGLVLLSGEAGIGKTALVDAFLAQTGPGTQARGWCPGAAETPPFGPWVDIVAALRNSAGADLAPPPPPFAGAATVPCPPPYALVDGLLAWLLAAAREKPLLIVLEDLHWADALSLDLLRCMQPRLVNLPLQIIATYRPDAVASGSPLATLLPDLLGVGAVRSSLSRLNPAEVTALATAALPDRPDLDDLARRLYQRTSGHPMFVAELLRLAARYGSTPPEELPLPETVQQAIDQRLSLLPPDALTVLQAAAAIGERFKYDILAHVTGLPEDDLIAALQAAMVLRLIAPSGQSGDRFAFDHALIREVLLGKLIGPRRRRLHLAVAEAMLVEPGADPEALAWHLTRAGDPRAAEALLAAMDRALRLGALAQATQLGHEALAQLSEGDARLGEVLLKTGFAARFAEPEEPRQLFERAAAEAGARGDRALQAWARHMLAWWRYGRKELDSLELMEAVEREEEQLLEDPRFRQLALDLLGEWNAYPPIARPRATALVLGGRLREAEAMAERLRPFSTGEELADLKANLYMYVGRAAEAIGEYRRAAQLRLVRKSYRMAFLYKWTELKAMLWAAADRPAELDAVAGEVAALEAEALERSGYRWMPEGFSSLGFYQFIRGDWEAARHNLLEYLALFPQVEDRTWWRWYAARMHLALGAPGAARAVMAMVRPVTPGDDLGFERISVSSHTVKAQIALALGDPDEARAWLEAADRVSAERGLITAGPEIALRWAELLRQTGDREAAARKARESLDGATALHHCWNMIEAGRLLGILAAEQGQPDAGRDYLNRALALAEQCRFPHEADLTRQALDRLPAPATAATETLPDGLTAREAEIIRLVAQGCRDKEIGSYLFIAVKTVQAHLRNIYNKAGVSNRAALVAYAARHGLVRLDPQNPH
jgi:ATP/maltotriose-dependent transcriptional regulator MalT